MLLALSKNKMTHVTNLVRIINSTYNQVNRNLQILEKEDIIKTKRYGHIKTIQLNEENPKTQALLKALYTLNKPVLNSPNPSIKNIGAT
jgi:predicted transcriptional regulator